jgi:hypothetical protein
MNLSLLNHLLGNSSSHSLLDLAGLDRISPTAARELRKLAFWTRQKRQDVTARDTTQVYISPFYCPLSVPVSS